MPDTTRQDIQNILTGFKNDAYAHSNGTSEVGDMIPHYGGNDIHTHNNQVDGIYKDVKTPTTQDIFDAHLSVKFVNKKSSYQATGRNTVTSAVGELGAELITKLQNSR